MVHVTAATTIGQFGQNLLQGSSFSLATLRKEGKAEQRPGRQREDRSEAGRHHDGVEREQNELQKVRAVVRWQSLLTATGAAGESCEPARRFMKHANDKNLCSKEGSISSFPPSQPTLPPGARSDTTPHLTAPPRCAVFQEVIYLPTSIFVRSTCSLKHNENSLPDQFVSEVSWLPAPLWVIPFCLHVRTIRLATA